MLNILWKTVLGPTRQPAPALAILCKTTSFSDPPKETERPKEKQREHASSFKQLRAASQGGLDKDIMMLII